MPRRSALLVSALLLPAGASGQEAGPIGTYVRAGAYEQTVKVRAGRASGTFAGSFAVSTKGCIGETTAVGQMSGPREVVFTTRESGEICRITLRFDPGFRSATVSEDNCLFWHGAGCDFEGTLRRQGR